MATKSNLNLYSRLKTKIHNIKSDIVFLKRCRKFNVIPKFIKIKCAVMNSTTVKVVNSSKRRWLNLEISSQFMKLSSIELELYNLHLRITKDLDCSYEFNQWLIFGTKLYENISASVKIKNKRLNEKFQSLLTNKSVEKPKKPLQVENFVQNLSSETFSVEELELLNYGLKFAVKPICDPLVDVVVDTETALKFKSESVKYNIRSDVKHVLKDYKVKEKYAPARNNNNNVQLLVKSLQEKDVYYIKADKGNSIIIMDKQDYDQRMLDHIATGNYCKTKNPLNKMVKSSNVVIKLLENVFRNEDGTIDKKFKWKLLVSNPVVPKLYGLPKVHKTGPLKMRPVVSNVNSPNYRIAKWLIRELQKLQDPVGCSIKNSLEFANKLNGLVLVDDEIMVSFDVDSLFPSIPVDIGLLAMEEWLTTCGVEDNKKEAYLSAAKLCLDDSYFQFRGQFYKLLKGTSMGNPISPLIANLVMSRMESILKDQGVLPRWWHRYVDDVFAVIKKNELDNILKMLNAQPQFPTIKFTVVPEKDGQLEFLDLLLIRKNNRVEVAVFHKPTSTKRLIPSTSHCPIQHKMAAFHSMAHRITSLPLSIQSYKLEYEYMKEAAIVNGYTTSMVDNIIKQHSDKAHKNNMSTLFSQQKLEKSVNRVRITYVPKVTNKLKSTFRRQNMEMVFSTQNKLCTMLGSSKDKTVREEKSGVYEITCSVCLEKYFGQTRRQALIRYREHLAAIKLNKPSKSSVASHSLERLHFNFTAESMKLIKVVNNASTLDAYESYYIHRHYKRNPTIKLMNTDRGNIESYLFNCV